MVAVYHVRGRTPWRCRAPRSARHLNLYGRMSRTSRLFVLAATVAACGNQHEGAAPVTPDAIVSEPAPADAQRPTRTMLVSLGFDDTLANQLTAATMLDVHGMRGTF